MGLEPLVVYAVVRGDYLPWTVAALYATRISAERHVGKLGGFWRVVEMEVIQDVFRYEERASE